MTLGEERARDGDDSTVFRGQLSIDRQARFIEDIHALMHRDASMRQTAFTITSAFMIAVQTLLLHQGRMHDIAYKWKHSCNDISGPIHLPPRS